MPEGSCSVRLGADQNEPGVKNSMNVQFQDAEQFLAAAAGPDWANEGDAYLLIDGARLPDLPAWLQRLGASAEWINLLGAPFGSSIFAFSPVLIRLSVNSPDPFVRRLLNADAGLRASSILVSPLSLRELADQLIDHLYIEDPDGSRWGLAFWDPAVLASLIGARPATSPLTPGPILSPAQCASLQSGVTCWCFRNRDGKPCAVRPPEAPKVDVERPLLLDQVQINQLADIALPDHVLAVVREAIPASTVNWPEKTLHRICCDAIQEARKQGGDDFATYCTVAAKLLTDAPSDIDASPTRTH